MTHRHIVGALNHALHTAMDKDDSIVVLGEDVGVDGGVFRVTNNLLEEHGEDRVVDTPLAEAGIIGTSIGMAINDMKPIPEIQFSGFTYQAFHQFKQHMSRFRQRSNGDINLPMVVRTPYAGGIEALEHHSESPESFFLHMQGLKVVVPSNPYNAKGLLNASIADPDPVVFLEPKSIYRSFKDDIPDEPYDVSLGEARTVQEGTDFTLITYGAMTKLAEDTADDIADKGYNAEIIDLQTLRPLDRETVLDSVSKTGRALVLHEAPANCGFGAELSSQIHENNILDLAAPVKRVAAPNIPYPQFAIEDYHLPGKDRLLNGVDELMQF
jgi:pyruvate dehydrogenase E1 component beta subunit